MNRKGFQIAGKAGCGRGRIEHVFKEKRAQVFRFADDVSEARLDDDLIDAMLEIISSALVPRARIAMPPKGAAVDRVPRDATAFWHREAKHSVMMIGFWDEPSAAAGCMQWVKAGWKGVEPLTDGFYVNEIAHDDPAHRVLATYGGNYDRLVALKKRYDPSNLLRMNANVQPRTT